jgi:hypothetical protein
MSLMSPRAIATIRRTTERWMVDTVEVWRGSDSTHDEDTLVEAPVPGDEVYSGKARVRPTRGAREVAIGEGVISLRDADILFPIGTPLLRIDDEVKVVTSEDPALVGTWFRITDVRAFSQQASRSVSAVQAQPSRTWPNLDVSEVGP